VSKYSISFFLYCTYSVYVFFMNMYYAHCLFRSRDTDSNSYKYQEIEQSPLESEQLPVIKPSPHKKHKYGTYCTVLMSIFVNILIGSEVEGKALPLPGQKSTSKLYQVTIATEYFHFRG